MSTRCQIHVAGSTASIYRHSDGYPDGAHGVLTDLLPLCKAFMAERGEDPEYMTAQIVADMVGKHHVWARKREKEYAKQGIDTSFLRQNRWIGYGVQGFDGADAKFHGDEEYIYVVQKDHVEVRQTGGPFWDSPTLENTTVLKRVDFDGKPHEGSKSKAVVKGE